MAIFSAIISPTGLPSLRGRLLNILLTSVCSSCFLLFGYDQGVMSGVLLSPPFLATMNHPSTLMLGTITSLYDVGAFLGCIAAAFTAEYLGRKRTTITGSSVLAIGTILMGSSYERIQFMFARVITGIGIGYLTSVAPVYQSETCRAGNRGWLVCCQLTTMLGGLMLAYWINYGLYSKQDSGLQWRFPLLFQLVFAAYILVIAPLLPDTPRWLLRHDGEGEYRQRGLEVLARLQNKPIDDPLIQFEGDQILAAIRLEAKEEGSWSDLFKSHGVQGNRRFYLSLGIQFMQQMTGINIVTYYAPTLFKTSLHMSTHMSLLMGTLLQVWYILASFVTWWTIDRVGRRPLLFWMAVGMCVVLVCEAICVRIDNSASAVAAVVFVFLFEGCFTWGWMATVWVYPAELLPLKLRAKGAALAAGADFLGNFLVVEITPPALANIGYRTYIIFAVLNIANAVIIWLFYPETMCMPLEAIDELFADDAEHRAPVDKPFYRKLQWSVVGRADQEVRRRKTLMHRHDSNVSEEVESRLKQDEAFPAQKGDRNSPH